MAAERLPRRVASPTSLPLSSCISMAASPACRPVAQERRPHAQPTRVSPAGCSPAAAASAGHRPPVSVDTVTALLGPGSSPGLSGHACSCHGRAGPATAAVGLGRGRPVHEPLTGGQSEPSRLTAASAGEQDGWPTAARPPPAPPPRLATGRRSARSRKICIGDLILLIPLATQIPPMSPSWSLYATQIPPMSLIRVCAAVGCRNEQRVRPVTVRRCPATAAAPRMTVASAHLLGLWQRTSAVKVLQQSNSHQMQAGSSSTQMQARGSWAAWQ
ncbi:uncharacterized protein LOC120661460 isoform X3 [Panicum virgatum]|nr:uncharacterized protein LOC120661460 isoform X3 [Panicum virgatum]